MNICTRRIGTFFVSDEFFHGLREGEGVNLFHGMVVLRASEAYPRRFGIEYIAVHPQFDELAFGEVFPEYEAVFSDGEIYPVWKRRL